jgi:hypothetical protein
LLIDRSTLESLREQINKLTDSVKEMQLTQKLLIEKGLNLKEEQSIVPLPTNPEDGKEKETEIINTPVETVAKAHEAFFGNKQKNNNWSILWLILAAILGITILLFIVNYIANQPL